MELAEEAVVAEQPARGGVAVALVQQLCKPAQLWRLHLEQQRRVHHPRVQVPHLVCVEV